MSYTAVGDQFRVSRNDSDEYGSAEQDVAWLSTGRFVVVYRELYRDGYAQVYEADGTPVGDRILIVSTVRSPEQPAVTALADGGFAVSWHETIDSDFAEGEVFCATYDANYVRRDEFYGNIGTVEGSQVDTDIVALAGGELVTVWTDYSGDSTIKGRLIDPPGDQFAVTAPDDEKAEFRPSAASLAGGNFVVAYIAPDASEYGVEARIYAPDATPLGEAFRVNTYGLYYQFLPQVAGLTDGGFVVVWQDESGAYDDASGLGDIDGMAIKAQVFEADGTRRGAEFLVNTITAGSQTRPAIAALSDGGFVVAWQGTPGDDTDVYAQAFTSDGGRSGGELLVNTTTAGYQYDVQVAAAGDSGFVVTWTSVVSTEGPYFTGQSVEARLFRPDGMDVGGIEGGAAGETLRGTAAGERVAGLGGDDVLFGLGGDDRLYGGGGDDVLKGGAGDDRLEGGADSDTADYAEATGGVAVSLARIGAQDTGGAGVDTLIAVENLLGSRRDDLLTGDAVANRLRGATGDDRLFGGGDDDFLFGDGGDDVLDGGAGYDVLAGGAGIDRFVLTSLDGDLIKDWRKGELIDVGALHAAAVQLSVYGGKTTARFDVDGDGFYDGSILIYATGLDVTDFVL